LAPSDKKTVSGEIAILIPARLASVRLPDKPLLKIAGRPMIVHVWEHAVAAGLGAVIVACADQVIADVITEAGGEAVLTEPALPSGSDRIAQALAMRDPERRYDTVINLQGDMPAIDPAAIGRVLAPLADPAVDIATLVVPIHDEAERNDPNVVKALVEFAPGKTIARAEDFTRLLTADHKAAPYHHVGIYAYRRSALETFVKLPPSRRELDEKLEQLRALDAGMRIDAALIDLSPVGVDTPADLEQARAAIKRAEDRQ
jgi:3-deoxy-manno-octulosonate cytidylyltransferase (CMP-KDO synthetase)